MADLADIHFHFDKYELRPDAVKIIEGMAGY
jgi:outer membrane protein OmpA-like peptidoglycan-associated protein